jgi:hypothetical protein
LPAQRKETLMSQYLLSVYYDEAVPDPSTEQMEQMYQDVEALNQKIRSAGAWVFAGGLHTPDTATVVRQNGAELLVTDGPLPEAKEQIGGFWIIDVPDMDAALAWAKEASTACLGPVEIRPFQEEPPV